MKITPTFHHAPVERQAGKKTNETNAKGLGFKGVLEAAIEGQSGVNQTASPPLSASVSSVMGLETYSHQPVVAGIQKLESFLAALTDYQQDLENPNCRLRDLATTFERMESEQRHLARWSETAVVDEALQSVINESLVTATLEIHRFRSGFYCS